MKAAERQLKIRQKFRGGEFVDVATLCRELNASETSVRRDLAALQMQNIVKRVYGGAVLLRHGTTRPRAS